MDDDGWKIVGNTLGFWRDKSRHWRPRWLFISEPKSDRLVGIGWLGLLLIWRDMP